MLLVLGLVPLVGAIVVFALPRGRDLLAKQVTLLFSRATLAITIGLCVAFTDDSPDRFQYVTSYEWIRSFGVSFALGVDGIALVLIAMSVVLMPVVILASWNDAEPGRHSVKTYFSLMLVLETMMIGRASCRERVFAVV